MAHQEFDLVKVIGRISYEAVLHNPEYKSEKIHVIEMQPVVAVLRQSREAILMVAHTVDERSPAYREIKKALEMIKEILP